MIDYKLVDALVAVLEAGGFEKAAQQLHITQSAISQRIKLLEARIGKPVLVRSNPPAPTAIGRRLHTHMQRVRHLEQELGLEMAEPARVKARIAVNADSLATWFAEALAQVGESLLADLLVEDQDTGLERMKMGDVLACLCSARKPLNGARADALGTMRYRAFASPAFVEHYLKDSSVPLYELPCLVFNNDDQLQHRFLASLNQPAPTQVTTCPSSEGFVQLAVNGCGFGRCSSRSGAGCWWI
jgi:LysR family transcriptional regulator (chromosome initiation inhibitor)